MKEGIKGAGPCENTWLETQKQSVLKLAKAIGSFPGAERKMGADNGRERSKRPVLGPVADEVREQ